MGRSDTSRRWALAQRLAAIALVAAAVGAAGCKSSAAAAVPDGAADASSDAVVLCPAIDAGRLDAAAEDGAAATGVDEFGPNAPAAKTPSALGRVNVYEVTSPRLLERVDVYLRAGLEQSRVTIAVQEAPSRAVPFNKLIDIQLVIGTCEGWTTSGPLAIPLEPGRFYAIGFDPNQPVTAFVSSDTDSLPIDGAFGRLVGSETETSVSVPTLGWDKLSVKEYNRQRLATSPRDGGATATDAATDGAGDRGG